MERWKAIKGFEGLYEISDHGVSSQTVSLIKNKKRWKHIVGDL